MQIRWRPFLPLCFFRSKVFVVVSGIVSLFMLLFVAAFHASFIYGMTAHSDNDVQLAWISGFCTTPIFCCLGLVCVIGPMVSIAMLDHLMQNPRVPVVRRSLWALLIIIGFGMTFYWYFHIFRLEDCGAPINAQV